MENERPRGVEAENANPAQQSRLGFFESGQTDVNLPAEGQEKLINIDGKPEYTGLKPDKKWQGYFKKTFNRVVKGVPAAAEHEGSGSAPTTGQRVEENVFEAKIPHNEPESPLEAAELPITHDTPELNPKKSPAEKQGDTEEQSSKEKPGEIFEKVASAAEKNEPIEKQYEKRHEIKDESPQQGASHIGNILAQTDETGQSRFMALARQAIKAKKDTKRSILNLPAGYKKAIKRGFWTAITLIIIFGLIAILII